MEVFMVDAPTPKPPPLLTVEDVMAWWRIDERTIYEMVRVGEIPAHRVGKRSIRFDRLELQAYLDSHPYTVSGEQEQAESGGVRDRAKK